MTKRVSADSTLRAAVRELFDCVSRYTSALPEGLRTYDVGQNAARTYFGLDVSTLDQLCSAGLPHLDGPFGRKYSFADLHFVALRFGRGSAYRRSITAWANTIAELGSRTSSFITVRLLPQKSADEAVILLPDRVGSRPIEANAEAAVITINQRDVNVAIPKDVRDAVAEIADYEFYFLPDEMPDRTELARTIRAGDCESVAGVLFQDLTKLGYEARVKSGLLVSVPYSTPHLWTEAMVDGQWVALDPLMITVMRRFGGLDPESWPPHRPVNIALIGVAEAQSEGSPLPIISERGVEVPTTFFTTIRPSRRSSHTKDEQ